MSTESIKNAATEADGKRSRRQLLAGAAAGALGIVAVEAIVNPTQGRATTADGDVVLGVEGQVGSRTTGVETQNGYPALSGTNNSSPGNAGVYGASNSNAGLYGFSINGDGLYAQSGASVGTSAGTGSNGVHGVTGSSSAFAVWGEHVNQGNGVYGSTTSPVASGVYGHNDDIGYGVAGRADSGTGTLGDSANGIGVLANSPNGTALSVSGKAKFSRSGMVSIPYPAKTATVTVPGGLSASALVLALMQNSVSGVWVASTVPNTSTGKATISLNKAPGSGTAPKTAKVAWFVVN